LRYTSPRPSYPKQFTTTWALPPPYKMREVKVIATPPDKEGPKATNRAAMDGAGGCRRHPQEGARVIREPAPGGPGGRFPIRARVPPPRFSLFTPARRLTRFTPGGVRSARAFDNLRDAYTQPPKSGRICRLRLIADGCPRQHVSHYSWLQRQDSVSISLLDNPCRSCDLIIRVPCFPSMDLYKYE
jgi:hypothetical protein